MLLERNIALVTSRSMIRAVQFPDNISNIVYRIEFYLHPNFSQLLYIELFERNPVGSKTNDLCRNIVYNYIVVSRCNFFKQEEK